MNAVEHYMRKADRAISAATGHLLSARAALPDSAHKDLMPNLASAMESLSDASTMVFVSCDLETGLED